MATVTKAANSHTVVTTGWTNPSNAYATTGNNVYATAAPAKNATVTGDFGFPAFTTSDIPDGATIDVVTVRVEWKVSTTTSATLGVLANNPAGTPAGNESTFSSTTEGQTIQQSTSITLADLRAGTVVARVRDTRGNSNTAHTGSLDFVSLTIDYTVREQHSGTGSLSLSSTITAAGNKGGEGSATLSGAASLISAGKKAVGGSGSLATAASFVAAAKKATTGTASLNVTASFLADGSSEAQPETHSGTGSLTVAASLLFAGAKVALGTASLSSSASVSGTGTKDGIGSGSLTPALLFTAGGGKAVEGSGTMALYAVLGMSGNSDQQTDYECPNGPGLCSLCAPVVIPTRLAGRRM